MKNAPIPGRFGSTLALGVFVDGKPRKTGRATVSGTPYEPRDVDPDGATVNCLRKFFDGEAHMVDDVDLGGGVVLEGFSAPSAGEEVERKQKRGDSAGSLDLE